MLFFAVLVSAAAVFGILARFFRLPLIAGYLAAGFFLSFLGSGVSVSLDNYSFLMEMGFAFLLFLLGMELDFREVKSLGRNVMAAGLTQSFVLWFLGYLVAFKLGFGPLPSVVLGFLLSFSSTIVIVKLLLEKQEVTTLYGRLAVGVLIFEDILATAILLGLGAFTNQNGVSFSLSSLLFVSRAGLLILLTLFLAKDILPSVFRLAAVQVELLFITAIAWCLIFVALASSLEFSPGIGAFLAGLALASSPYRHQIVGRIKPVRDFFIAVFFVRLGGLIDPVVVGQNFLLIGTFVFLALFVKPLIFSLIFAFQGFRRHTIFQAAVHLSQTSEFALIILVSAQVLNLVDKEIVSLAAVVTGVTMTASVLVINSAERIYRAFSPFLKMIESPKHKELAKREELTGHAVLIGCRRAGEPILEALLKKKHRILVVDFNPEVVKNLSQKGVPVVYGDVSDPDVLENLNLGKAKLVISTAHDLHDNLTILDVLKEKRSSAEVVMTAEEKRDSEKLYKKGADWVVLPMQLEGEVIARALIKNSKLKSKNFN